MIRRHPCFRVIAIAAGLAVCSPVLAADKPTTKPASVPTPPPTKPVKKTGMPAALTKAIEDLQKEFADFSAKPDSVELRKAPDYFKSLPADTTVDDVLSVIEKNMSGSGPQVAYVKWQLMSALPTKVEGPQAARVFNAYRNAPTPLTPFTADVKVRQQLDKMIVGMKDGQETAINDQLAKRNAPIAAANAPIIAYRDSLYEHLPTNLDVLMARLQDAVSRVQAGNDPDKLLGDFESEVRTWLSVGANPQQANALMSAVREAKKVKPMEVYTEAEFKSDNKPPGMTWKKKNINIGGAAVTKIEDTIKEYLNNPQGGLKFK